jgi:integrase
MVSPLRQRMIDDIRARKLGRHSLRSHIHSCKRFAAFLKRSPETATADDVRRFQLTLIEEEGLTICNRNRVMTGVKFLLRVTMRRHDLAAEIYHLKEPQKVPVVLSGDEVKRILLMAPSRKARTMLTISYGCGLRAGEVTRLTVGDIDSAQNIIRVVQRSQGSQRHAAAGCARAVARVVARALGVGRRRNAVGRALDFPRQWPPQADHATSVQPSVSGGRQSRRYPQARADLAFAAPQLCDAPARTRYRHSNYPSFARTRQT